MIEDAVEGRTILVTGGAGFIGSHIVDALVGENEVRVVDDFSSGRREYVNEEAELIEGDIRDSSVLDEAMAGVDLVFHQAAVVSVEQSIEEPRVCHAVNVDATLSLLERAREADARVVVASSAAVYGHPESIPICEDDPKEPLSPYGLDKLAIDGYVRRYHDLYGLETVVLRYFNAYGPRQLGGEYSGVIDIFTRQALDGGPITVDGDGTQTRDFIFVDDLVRANLLAANTDATGEALNIATGQSVTIRELAERVREVTGSDAKISHTDPRPGDIDQSRADVSKARSMLDFDAEVGFDEGLSTYAEWRVQSDG